MWCMDPFPNHLLRTEVLPPVVVTRSPKLDIACPRTISKYRDTSAPRKRSLCPKSLQLVPSWCLILPLADLSNPGGHPAPPPICQARPGEHWPHLVRQAAHATPAGRLELLRPGAGHRPVTRERFGRWFGWFMGYFPPITGPEVPGAGPELHGAGGAGRTSTARAGDLGRRCAGVPWRNGCRAKM